MFSITKPRVPEGLRDLMKDLTREILKEKPTDIYNFAEYYFLSRLPEKEHYKVKEFEDNSGKYDFSYIQNSQRYQIPVALVYSIIPECLTNLIKDLIKAILREQPENLCDFAVEYFRHLKATMKSVNPTENISKDINYSAYENYFNNKERFLLTPYVKCKCGRILGESEDSNYNVIQNDDKKDKNKGRNISERDFTFTEKYLNSVILIQQYFRRYLKTRNTKTNINKTLKDSAITEQLNQTSKQSKIIIPQLHLNQVEVENVSEDPSYTSASTAVLSASESGRDNSDLSTTESIPTKTIIECEEIENNEKNFPTYLNRIVSVGTTHQSRSDETTDDDSKSTLNDKKLYTGEGDAHKLTGVQSNKPRNLDIIREIKPEKSIEDNKEEPSEIDHFLSNEDLNEYVGNSSVTDGSGSFFADHKEINSELFVAKPVIDTKMYSNEGENNQNEIINASSQTKKKPLESIKKISIAENMNADSENTRKTFDRQQENSSIKTNVVLSESKAVEIQHESNKPQTYTNNSDTNFEIEFENKIFANENVNDNGSLEKNLQNLALNISRDHITNSDISTEEQKFLKSNEYSKEKNTECIKNDLNDVHVEGGYSGLSTNTTLNTDGPKNKDDPVYEHNNFDGNPINLKYDRESVQQVLTLPVNEQNIQTTDVTTDKIPYDVSANIIDFNPDHEKSEHMDTNKESGILGENQNNLSTFHESNNTFNEQDTNSSIINDEEDKTDNDSTREKNSNILNNVKSNDNYSKLSSDREIEINTISKAHNSEFNSPNVNKNDNIPTSSIADLIPENHQTGSIVQNLKSSEIFSKGDNIITNIEKALDNSTDSEKLKVLEDLEMKENAENGFVKPKTELYETDVIDKPEADITVEGTFDKNYENIRNDTKDNMKSEINCNETFEVRNVKNLPSTENYVMNDTIPNDIVAAEQITAVLQINCKEDQSDENKPEQSIDQIIVMEERKLKEEENQNDDKKLDENRDIEKEGMTIEMINSENTKSDVTDDQTSIPQTNPSNENNPEQRIHQNEKESQSDESKFGQNQDIEEEGTTTVNINSENIRSGTTDNLKTGQKCKLNVDDSVGNDTVSGNIIPDNQYSETIQTRPNEENKQEERIEQNIDMEERKSNEKESQSDENKSSQNNDMEREGTTTEKVNSENIKSDVSDNSETGQTFKLNVDDFVGNDTISDNIIADNQYSETIQTRPNEENKQEERIEQNIDMEKRKSNEKESQNDENKSSQNHDMEKEGTATEKTNFENIKSDVSDNSEIEQKIKFNIIDSVGNDTISGNIIPDDQSNTTLQTRPSEGNKPGQSIDQNIDIEERKSNENESESDENKSNRNHDMEIEVTSTEKVHSKNIRSNVSDNSETGQKFKLNVDDSVGNDTISGNIIPDDQSNTTLQTRISEENKQGQSTNQNTDMEERKSNEKENQTDENKSSQNHDVEKEGTATEKTNSENIKSDVSDNSETGQTFKLNVDDFVGNNTISDNIIAGDQYSMISQTRPSEENKPGQSIEQNIEMEERKLNEKESQSGENKSSRNHNMEKVGTTTEKTNSENIKSYVSDNSETGQTFKLNVDDSVGNDTISGNTIPDDQSSTTIQTRPSEGNKSGQSLDQNIDMKERKSNEKESQNDENKSSQNYDLEKEATTTEKINSENIRSDVSDNSDTGQNFELNVVDSVGNDTISGNTIPDDQSNTTIQTRRSEQNKPGQNTDQNIDMKEIKSNEKESQSDENKSSQNHDMEKEAITNEKINAENKRSDGSDNSETGQTFKFNVDSVGNDTISGNIIPDDLSNTTLQTRPSEEDKPGQITDQYIDMKEIKSNEIESQTDENKSSQNYDMEIEGTATEKTNSENIKSDVSDNSETGQTFKLNVDDSVGNDTISDNIIVGDEYSMISQTSPSEENKPGQSIEQNIEMEERKSNEKESQSDENKSSRNHDMEKEGTTTEKTNSENIKSDVSDNSKTGLTFKLNVDDSVGNDTISGNIIPDDQSSTTIQIRPSEENKPRQITDQNIENKSSQNHDMEKEATTTEKINSENIRSDVSDNSETGQNFELNVVDPIGNDTFSDNIIAGDQLNAALQTNPSNGSKPEQIIDENIDLKEAKKMKINRNNPNDLEKENIHLEDTINFTTDNLHTETNSDHCNKFHYKNADESFEQDILNTKILGRNMADNRHMEKEGTTSEKISSENTRSGATDNLNTGEKFKLNIVDSVGNDRILDNIIADDQTSMTSQTNPSEVNKPEQSVDQNIVMEEAMKMKKKQNDTNDVENENIRIENTATGTTDNLNIKIKSDENCEITNDNDSPENYILNKTILDNILVDNQVNTTIPKSNRENPNDENIELKQNLVQRIDIEDKKKTEMTQNGTKVAINEGINFDDTITKETDNSATEINSDENRKHHDKNASESIENYILNKTILGKSLTGNKQKLEQNEENLDQNKLKTGTSTDSTQEIHHENVSISDNIVEGEQSITHSLNSAQIKCNETKDDTGKNYEKSLELIENNDLKKAILIENLNVKQGPLTTEENESFEIKHRSGGISDQTINKEKETKLYEINCDNARCENGNVKQEFETRYDGIHKLHTEKLNIKANTEEPMANETDNIVDSTVKCCGEPKVSEAEITSNHGSLKSSKSTENPSIFCRNSNITDSDLISDLKEQPSSILTNSEKETENEFDKKKSISDQITNSDNKDGVMASVSNKTDKGSKNISTLHEHTSSTCNSINNYIESHDSKENDSFVSTKDNGVVELDKENTTVLPKVSQINSEFEDLSALITSNKIEKECKINDDDSITKIASEAYENTATTQQKQELSPKESFSISDHNGGDNLNSTNVTKTMESLKTSAIPTNLIMREDDLKTIDQLELSKEVKHQISTEKINEINHLEIETDNCSKTNIENNFSHNESVNSHDNKLKHTEINNNEGKSNDHLNTMRSQKSSHLNVTDNKSYEDITKIESIRETRLVSDVGNDIEITHQENHEAPSYKLSDDANGKGDTSDQATTLSIGNKTPKSVIGIQNFNIDRIRFYNEGLLGSISGQRFAETHLRSFWKEYLMNNSKPLGQYDNETDGIYSNQLLDSEKYEPQESKSTTYFDKNQLDEKQENTNVEPTIVKETTKDSELIPANKQNLPPTHTINKDAERIPRYFYGALEELEDNKTVASKPKTYKEPLAFIIPIGDINKARTAKTDAGKKLTATNSNNETHIEVLQKDLSNNFTNLDLTFCATTESLLEAETPPKPFEDLNQFEHRVHDVDLDFTYAINEILSLKYENDLQNNSDENDENLNDSMSDYSLTPEPMLQTIIELSESETPRPLKQLQSNNDNNIDLTSESNEGNSLISDDILEDENEKKSYGHTHTSGGIYEYSTNEFHNVAHLNDKTLNDNSHVTPPNTTDAFEEVSKEISGKNIQAPYHDTNTNRIFLIDSSNKHDENIGSKNTIDNIEACSENIPKEEGKTIDYCNKNETDFGPSVDLHLKDETLLDNKQIVSIIPSLPNDDSLHEDLKGIAAKKIQRVYRQHLQKTSNRVNKDNLKTNDNIRVHDVELVSTMVDSLNTKFNNTDSSVEEIDNSDKTFRDEKEEIKKFDEFSKNSTSSDEQESESVSTNTENCNECSSAVTNNLKKGYNRNIENNNNQPLCKAEKHHEQHNFNDVSPKRETSSFTGNLQSKLDISANDRLSPNPTLPKDDSLHENFKEIAAKKIQRVYRQHLQKTAKRDSKGDLETNDTIKAHDLELNMNSTVVDSFNSKFSEIDSPEGVIEIEYIKKGDNIDNSDKTFKDERNSKEQDKKFVNFSKNSNNSDEQESEPVNSNSEMKNMNNNIERSSEYYSTVTNNLKMGCNGNNENNNNQSLHKAEKYHEQHNIIEKSFTRENSSITGNLQSELNVTANDRSNQKPSTSEAANDNDMQVTDPTMNTDKAAKIIQLFFKKFIKPKHKSNTNTDLRKTHWFVGDEPIVATEETPPLPKTKSEISFDETEAYVILTTNLPQYLVDSNSSEAIDTNSFSRTPTAPITNQSSDSCRSSNEDSLIEKCINLPKGSVLTDASESATVTAPYIGIQSSGSSNEKKSRYTNLINQFITSERFYSGIVNRNYSYSDIKDIKFPSSNITEITKIITEFLDARSENLKSDIRYEILEEPGIKKSVEDEISSSGSSSSSDIDDAEDSLGTKTKKLQKPEIAIIKMQKRRNSTSKISNLDNIKDYNFNEPSVISIENLDTDEEGIVVARLQRDETRESTGQSDVDVVIGSTIKEGDSNLQENFNFDSTFPSKGSLKRVYTIGDEVEAKFLLKNVTIDESIKYIEPPDYELNDSSLCLDDETTANIRHKMMAYSLSEADSDVFERTIDNLDSSSWELRNKRYDDFNISTALIDNGDTSTETESTTVSAVTKIQARTRGSFNSSKASIGNAAISESLEHLVKEAAAKKIQKMYKQHYRLKTANANNNDKSPPECSKSMESTLAQKRSIMLQRGDALRNGSSPEEATSSSNSGESESGKIISKIKDTSCIKSKTLPEQESKAIFTDNITSSCSLPSSAKSAAAIRAKKIEDNKRRWIAMRQNSMPVQIDSEVLRVIPKYIRKKIKSAEGEKKKDRRRMLMD